MVKPKKNVPLDDLLINIVKKNPVPTVFFLLIIFILFPILIVDQMEGNLLKKIILFTGFFTFLLLASDIVFRFIYRLLKGMPYKLFPRPNFEKLYVKSHPYIPYVMKSNHKSEVSAQADYPLHKGKFNFVELTTNNMGFFDGTKGNRDIIVPKPKNIKRVICMGASTTGNYIEANGKVFSYPLELEKILQAKNSNKIEVNNCGQGGYNSADILVRYALQIIDFQPDIIVLYHAYNDITPYLTKNFKSDYSHARSNLAMNYWKFYLASKIPSFSIKFVNFLINKWMPSSVRDHLLAQVTTGTFDEDLDFTIGLKTYKRNIQHIIDLSKKNKIEVILSTYCHFIHDKIKEEKINLLYDKIVKEENKVMIDLAQANKLKLVDNYSLVPQNEKYFVDSVHFSPEGMKLVAKNIAEVISK